MHLFYWILGVLLAVVWLWQLANVIFGMPRVMDVSRSALEESKQVPSLTVIVPARNEGEHIRACLTSLLSLEYPDVEVIAVNDRSVDATSTIMEELASDPSFIGRLHVIHVTELPSGWLGKTHAMWKAASQAKGDWLLFTDGDVQFRPDALRRVVTYAEKDSADHVVLYPTMIMKTPGERMMLSYFLNNIAFIHRPWKVSDPKARDFVGAGAFNLIRRSAYEAIGTYESMRLAIVDDLALGKAIKDHGFAQRAVRGPGLASLHWANGAMGVVNNLTKNFFALMRYQWPLTMGAAIGAAFLGLGPVFGLIFAPGLAKSGFAVALLANLLVYLRMEYFTRVSPLYFFTHPVACVLVIYTMLRSTFVTLWDGGVTWRGTKYSLEELRTKSSL